MPAALADRDRRAMLDAAVLLADCTSTGQLMARASETVRRLLDAEVAAYTCIDVADRRASVVVSPSAPRFVDAAQHVGRTLHDNPLTAHWATNPDAGPSRVSDHVSRSTWLATSVYGEVLAPLGTPHMLGIPVSLAASGGPSIAVVRGGRDFGAREVALAAALQAVLVALDRRLTARPLEVRVEPAIRKGSIVLTARESDVLALLGQGVTAQVIAHRLAIAVPTVRKHLEHLYVKLGAHDRLTAVNRAHEAGFLP